MIQEYGDKVVDVVPNSVDRAQFFAPIRGKQPVPTVGFLFSTGIFVKGIDVLIAALTRVCQRIPNLRAISFGRELPSVNLPLPKSTEYFYCPPQDQLRNLYSQCDVWITASRSEGFNLPALEAMACRTPVVATRTGWPEASVKTGWNGVLVDIDDVTGLSHAIESVLNVTEVEWRKLSQNAYATAASGSWEESAASFEKALERACWRSTRGEIGGPR